jgi:hypothetical protein
MSNPQILAELRKKLPFGNTPQDIKQRDFYWSCMDVNGSGYLNLAEVDKGMRLIV